MNLLIRVRYGTEIRPGDSTHLGRDQQTRYYHYLLFVHFLYLKDSSDYGQHGKNNIFLALILF